MIRKRERAGGFKRLERVEGMFGLDTSLISDVVD